MGTVGAVAALARWIAATVCSGFLKNPTTPSSELQVLLDAFEYTIKKMATTHWPARLSMS